MNAFQIMDVTLRDGSYQINFQFSNQDVRNIGGGLDKLGIPFVEIGHGLGIGASSERYGVALHTDEEYLQAAKESIQKAKIGMFCIPGTAKLEQLERLCDAGLDFVRVGTNVDAVEASEPYIRLAKKKGIAVMANYMKSYAVPPEYFAEQVIKSQRYGADMVYLVDSAGSMMPEDIRRYYEAIRRVSSIGLGYHGHDNLGLALSNSLFAVELGFELVDASLQGMGRSAGNTVLERLVAIVQKSGAYANIDINELLLLGKRHVAPLGGSREVDPIDTICGVTGFHSSYLQAIHRQSGKYGVSPLELIERYAAQDQLNMDEKKLEAIARSMKPDPEAVKTLNLHRYLLNEQG